LSARKPAITRALDRLQRFNFTQRRKDPHDRRSIVVDRTPIGVAYIEALLVRMNVAAA
jgi:DNA-binding MarR family transcriptional regulator